MELHEFEVRKACPRPVGYSQPVSGSDVRVARVQVYFPRAPRAQQHGICNERVDLVGRDVQHIHAPADILLVQVQRSAAKGVVLYDQIEHQVVFEDHDIGVRFHGSHEHFFNGLARKVLRVQDAFAAVAPFPAQVEAVSAAIRAVERNTQSDQVLDPVRTGPDNQIHYVGMAQSVSCLERILDVKLKRVVFTKNGRYAPLRIIGAGFQLVFFRYNSDGSAFSCFQSERESSYTASDDQVIELIFHFPFPYKRSRNKHGATASTCL